MGFLVANLRDYASHHPPGVTFLVCLLTLSLSFICLSYYGFTHTLPNPDAAMDWNHMLLSLSRLQLCTDANVTSVDPGSPVPSTAGTSPLTQLRLQVPLAVMDSPTYQPGVGIHATLMASQLGLVGSETVNVTLQQLSQPKGNDTYTCLTISAPAHLLPETPLPPGCPVNERMASPIHVTSMEGSHPPPTASHSCYVLQATHDPTLTAMLTQEEQGVAVRHLLEVSACLIGVCVVLCYAVGSTHSLARRYHGNGVDLQREPLIDS